MDVAVYLPLLLSALFGVVAPRLSRRIPPAAATWLLSGGGLLAAGASSASLVLLAFTLVAQTPALAERAHWSDQILHRGDPVSGPVAAAAIACLGFVVVRIVVAGRSRLAALVDAHRLAATLPAHGAELAVVTSADVAAYAVPGRPGRIVVTSGLLRRLDASERRAVLAHERSHLERRHHLHQSVAHLAAAANPLLRALPDSLASACERSADEDAAAACRRDTVARALTHAGTGTRSPHVPPVVLAGVVDVADRIDALHAPAPRLSLWRVALLVALLTVALLAVAEAAHDTERLFELAQFAYRAGIR